MRKDEITNLEWKLNSKLASLLSDCVPGINTPKAPPAKTGTLHLMRSTNPLSDAIIQGKREIISLGMLEDNLNTRDSLSKTPLHYAVQCESESYHALQHLLDLGADCTIADNKGKTALHYALQLENRHRALCLILLDTKIKTIINQPDNDGKTPLHYLAQTKKWDYLGFLLACGAESNCQDNDEKALLHYTVQLNDYEGLCKLLAVKDINVDIQDIDGKTPLFYGMCYQNHAMCEKLLEAGADPNCCTIDPSSSIEQKLTWNKNTNHMQRTVKRNYTGQEL